jgi:hypothetical protein
VISPVPVATGDLRTSWLERSASAAALLALLLFVVSQRVSVDDGSPRVIARTPAINEPAPPATAELPALALEFQPLPPPAREERSSRSDSSASASIPATSDQASTAASVSERVSEVLRSEAEPAAGAEVPERARVPVGAPAVHTDKAEDAAGGEVRTRSEAGTQGRELLESVALGEGPDIEIAWPESDAARARLFDYFHDCLGMRVARYSRGRLLALEPGIDQSDVSPLLRVVNGRQTRREEALLAALRSPGVAARVFPRQIDEDLLQQLNSRLGERYGRGSRIRGSYLFDTSGRPFIGDLRVQGQAVGFTIDFPSAGCAVRTPQHG